MDPRVVILAAGASRRLGQPKALVDLPGGRPVLRLVRAALEVTGERPVVVTGAHHAEIAAALDAEPELGADLCLFNPSWDAGRTGGLQLAQRRSPGRDLCVLAVDQPRIPATVLAALLAAWREAERPPMGWLAPGYVEATPESPGSPRPGHPVVFGAELAARLQDFGPDQPLRDLRAESAPLWMLETDDRRVLEDLDRPEDLVAIRRADAPG